MKIAYFLRSIRVSSMAGLSLPYIFFSHCLKRHSFRGRGGIIEHKMCFKFWLQLSSEIFLVLRRIERDIIVNVHRSSSTHYSFQILTKLEFSQQIFEKRNTLVSNFMNIHLVGAALFRADGQTWRR